MGKSILADSISNENKGVILLKYIDKLKLYGEEIGQINIIMGSYI